MGSDSKTHHSTTSATMLDQGSCGTQEGQELQERPSHWGGPGDAAGGSNASQKGQQTNHHAYLYHAQI